MGNASVQRGPLWWAAHHRHHHRYTDQEQDVHSPSRQGFWWSQIGWLTSKANFPTKYKYVAEWAKYPELRWLNRFDTVIPIMLALALYVFGALLERFAPHLGTSGMQMVVWGFFISTTVLLHATATINSLDHMYGRRRYDTQDTRFFWWEIDITYYLLVFLSWLGIVGDLRTVPKNVLHKNRIIAETSTRM
jgi:stearoyl-CoA desaturase (delta-9 desaturase)